MLNELRTECRLCEVCISTAAQRNACIKCWDKLCRLAAAYKHTKRGWLVGMVLLVVAIAAVGVALSRFICLFKWSHREEGEDNIKHQHHVS